ncbi:MAG: hypothetical protein ACHQ03_08655 [Candidatus Bathyarchaeia archaeon]
MPKKKPGRKGVGKYIPIYESNDRKVGVSVGALWVNSKKKKKSK